MLTPLANDVHDDESVFLSRHGDCVRDRAEVQTVEVQRRIEPEIGSPSVEPRKDSDLITQSLRFAGQENDRACGVFAGNAPLASRSHFEISRLYRMIDLPRL